MASSDVNGAVPSTKATPPGHQRLQVARVACLTPVRRTACSAVSSAAGTMRWPSVKQATPQQQQHRARRARDGAGVREGCNNRPHIEPRTVRSCIMAGMLWTVHDQKILTMSLISTAASTDGLLHCVRHEPGTIVRCCTNMWAYTHDSHVRQQCVHHLVQGRCDRVNDGAHLIPQLQWHTTTTTTTTMHGE